MEFIQHFLPDLVSDKIARIKSPSPGYSDFLNWKLEADGQFSFKSVLSLLNPSSLSTQVINPLFQKVNHWKGPARIRSHLWKLTHGGLLTNEERVRRGMADNSLCPRCNSAPETLMHVLRDCEAVQEFWNKYIDRSCWSKFFSIGSFHWLEWILSVSQDDESNSMGLVSFFGVAFWTLWKDGNSLNFYSSIRLHTTLWSEVNSQVYTIAKEFQNPSLSKDMFLGSNQCGWQNPPMRWYKINRRLT